MRNKKIKIYSKNFFSNLFFYYINKLIELGNRNDYDYNQIPDIENNLIYHNRKKEFIVYINKNKTVSLKKWIIIYFFKKNYLAFILLSIAQFLFTVIPLVLKKFIDNLNQNFSLKIAIIYGTIIFIWLILKVFIWEQGVLRLFKSRNLLFSLYSTIISIKLNKLNNKSKNILNIGKVTSMLTVDIIRVTEGLMTAHHIFVSPSLIIIYTSIISIEIGYYSWIIPLILIFFLTILYLFIYPIISLTNKKLVFNDIRGKNINEIIQGIKIIKINAWENIMLKKVLKNRKMEEKVIILINFIKQFQDGIIGILPSFIGFVVISIYNYNSNTNLSIGSVIFLILIFNNFTAPLKFLFITFINLFESNIALNRLDEFYNLKEFKFEDLNKYDKNLQKNNLKNGEIIIKGSFFYEKNDLYLKKNTDNICTIENIDLNINTGEFIGIIGNVGSGKSCLLKTILGILEKKDNSIMEFKGSISYIPQESFLINDSLKNNILFGNEFDINKYEEALRICELEDDIMLFPNKDLVEIGERGINLSGGQKQRISIARSIYNDSDIYLVDDCLSALDAEIGNKIFNNVFLEKLKKQNKTILMATHSLQFINKMDKIIMIENGKIKNIGTFNYLINNDMDFKNLIKQNISENDKTKINNKINLSKKSNIIDNVVINLENGKWSKEEKKHTSIFNSYALKKFIKYGGICLFLINILLNILFVLVKIFSDFWISAWSTNSLNLTNNQYFLYFSIIMFTLIIIKLLNSYLLAYYFGKISFNIFYDLINKIIRKKLSFFDTTPIGQLLNLITKDIDFVDIWIPYNFGLFLSIFFLIIGTIIFISINNIIIIPIVILFIIILIFSITKYLKISIRLRKFSQLTYSPILSNISELLEGFNIFKSQNKLDFQKKKFDYYNDYLIRILYLEDLTKIWINFRIEIIICFLIGFLIYFIIIGFYYKLSFVINNSEIIGLSISYLILINSLTNLFLSYLAEFLKGFSNVERIILNVNSYNFEDDWDFPENKKLDWLSKNNNIIINNLSVKYRKNLEYILKNITFQIENKEKVGIVGRTGCGKSTFILSIMRLLENNGTIIIDGVDISNIGLHVLRKNLKLIPQDPFIIEGNLKDNIDPINIYEEKIIRNSIELIFGEFLNKFKIDENGNKIDYLDYKILEKGKNLSLGEKQLICICRIIIEKPKILLMDEATSNIDYELDKRIQLIIKNEFKDSTIITVAHRLSTIINYDKIIFLDNGEILEIGNPKKLLNNKKSNFYNLVKKNGMKFLEKMKQN